MTSLAFTVLGRPATWQRSASRQKRRDARGKASLAYRLQVAWAGSAAVTRARIAGITWPLDSLYLCEVAAWWPDARFGDCDRLGSNVLDALEGILWRNDRLVRAPHPTLIGVDKTRPRIVVSVRTLERVELEAIGREMEARACAAPLLVAKR